MPERSIPAAPFGTVLHSLQIKVSGQIMDTEEGQGVGRERMETGGDEYRHTGENKGWGCRPAVHTPSPCPRCRDAHSSTSSVSSPTNGPSDATCQGSDEDRTGWPAHFSSCRGVPPDLAVCPHPTASFLHFPSKENPERR